MTTSDPAPANYFVRYFDGPSLRDRVEVRNPQPDATFSRELLVAANGGDWLTYDGETITVDVDNGRWVWVVTGQSADGSVVYGRWPD